MSWRLIAAIALAACILLVSSAGLTHPQHRSTAQVEVDKKRKVLEVALRVLPDQLEEALTKWRKPEEKQKLTDAQKITRYLQDKFRVVGDDSTPARILWVGRENDGGELWLFFELKLPSGKAYLSNRVFFELSSEQLNVVQIRSGKNKRTVLQTIKNKPLLIPL